MSVKNGLAKLHFIVATDTKSVDPETRKVIRSHVMRGKNRKPSKKLSKLSDGDNLSPDAVTAVVQYKCLNASKILSSKYAGVRFAADIEPTLIEDMIFFESISSQVMFLIHRSIQPTSSDISKLWFPHLLADPAYLYTTCIAIQTLLAEQFGRVPTEAERTRDHMFYAKAIKAVQERLTSDDDSIKLSDSTIMTVLTLSGHAYTTSDYRSNENHLDGLLQLVSMRGAKTLVHNTRLLIEIIRSDLSMAIDRVRKPVLFNERNIPWGLIGTEAITTPRGISDYVKAEKFQDYLTDGLNHQLARIWTAAAQFCKLIDAAAENTGPQITEDNYLHYMGSIMYRLLHHRFVTGSLDEVIRLALLAFLSPLFLNWNRVELSDQRFNGTYRAALAALTLTNTKVNSHLRLWLFMVGALSMSHESGSMAWLRSWLEQDSGRPDIRSWTEVKALLNSFLWTAIFFDTPAKEIYLSMILKEESDQKFLNPDETKLVD